MADKAPCPGSNVLRRKTPCFNSTGSFLVICARNLLRDDAIIATDCGIITTWAARRLMIRGGMKFPCSGTLATMACGLPYPIVGGRCPS
jgi:hypothetical protein